MAEEFIKRSFIIARQGIAMLTRTNFIESIGRYERLFSINPPTKLGQFSERLPMSRGRVDPELSSATSYCWLVWEQGQEGSKLLWIPPCRDSLEKSSDYEIQKFEEEKEKIFELYDIFN